MGYYSLLPQIGIYWVNFKWLIPGFLKMINEGWRRKGESWVNHLSHSHFLGLMNGGGGNNIQEQFRRPHILYALV